MALDDRLRRMLVPQAGRATQSRTALIRDLLSSGARSTPSSSCRPRPTPTTPALAGDQAAGAVEADIRLRYLRGRRTTQGPDRADDRPDRGGDHADSGRTPDRGRPLGGRVAARDRPYRRRGGCRTYWRCAVTRLAIRTASGGSILRIGAMRSSWFGWSGVWGVLRRGRGASRRASRRRRASKPISDFFVEKCAGGADFAMTRCFFDVEDYLRFRRRVAGGAARCRDRRDHAVIERRR